MLQVIIMLPDHVSMIFLSATTPNTAEFSDWIGRTRRRPVHVVTTNYRPVPLRHHLFCGNELIKVLDQGGDFDLPAYRSVKGGRLVAIIQLIVSCYAVI